MDLYCDTRNKRFAWGFGHNAEVGIVLTQDNNQPIRLYLVQPGRHPGTPHPFCYDPASGDGAYTTILSLRNITAGPITLASTQPLTPIRNGFEGILNLNTQEIADFLEGRAEREAAFCVDLVDGDGNRISPFRRPITLQATDAGATTTIPGVIYDPTITGLTGGGSSNLDGQVTEGRALGTLFIIIRVISGARSQSVWQLIAGNDPTDEDAGIVQPLDYDAGTNAVQFVRVDGL